MKKLLQVIALFILSAPVVSFAQDNKKTDGPQMVFQEESHDFGAIKEGVIAEYTFKFTNTGTQPLILTDVRPSCGCTTPDWSKEPVGPGKTGVIKVKYNSSGRPGRFNKSITITSNIQNESKVLFISGTVTPTTENTTDPNQSPVRIGN
jgi:hypothetical protein